MAISKEMLEIVMNGIKWVTDKLTSAGTNKRELHLKIDDLEKELVKLSEGNNDIQRNIQLITSAVIAKLKEDPNYSINIDIDTITFTGVNNGEVITENRQVIAEANSSIIEGPAVINTVEASDDDDEEFFITDEDLVRARLEKRH